MGKTSVWLGALGTAALLIAWWLFLRMAVALNKVVPPEKRISLIESRNHISRIRRLYEDSFPQRIDQNLELAHLRTAGAR